MREGKFSRLSKLDSPPLKAIGRCRTGWRRPFGLPWTAAERKHEKVALAHTLSQVTSVTWRHVGPTRPREEA